jgi:hypothetical protein
MMPEDALEKLLGDDVLGKLRKRRISKATAPAVNNVQATGITEKMKQTAENTTAKKMTAKEYFDRIGKD